MNTRKIKPNTYNLNPDLLLLFTLNKLRYTKRRLSKRVIVKITPNIFQNNKYPGIAIYKIPEIKQNIFNKSSE